MNTWQIARLRDVAPPIPSAKKFSPDEIVWMLTLDQIESETGNIIDKVRIPAFEAGVSSQSFDEENVLYSKLRPYLNKVVLPDEPGISTTELVPLQPKKNILDRRFLYYFLRTSAFLAFANQNVAGVKMPRVIMERFWQYQIPLPPLSEQRRIVEILDQADALRKKRAETDKLTEKIIPALFYELFGNPKENPKGWRTEKLGTHIKVQGGFAFKSDDFLETGPLLVRIGNLVNDEIIINESSVFLPELFLIEYEDYKLAKGDVLIALTGATTGKLARFDLDLSALLNQRVGRFVKKEKSEIHLDYLFYLMKTEKLQSYIWKCAKGFGQPNIAPRQIEDYEITIPPKELQEKFSLIVQRLRLIKNKFVKSHSSISDLYRMILDQAFLSDLTVKWREAHMKELLQEMEQRSKELNFK